MTPVFSKPSVIRGLCWCTLVLLLPFLTGAAPGQIKLAPRLTESYGQINAEDMMARLDFFAIELQKHPHAVAHIVAYGPEGEIGGTGRHILSITKDYLVNSRGIDPTQIEISYGGRYKDPSDVFTELWLVPAGAGPPKIKRYSSELKLKSGKFASGAGWDGPVDGHGYPGDVKIAAFADHLRNEKESVGYIVGYNHPEAAPGAWRRVAKEKATRLEQGGIKSERIKIVFGGSRKQEADLPQYVELEYWILPSNAAPPVRTDRRETTPKEAMQIGSYSKWELGHSEHERTVFEGFAEVLKADVQLRVCLIVYAELPEDDPSPPLPGEPPDIDPNKLVQQWKKELQEKFGIDENRIIILNAGARESEFTIVDVWVVPIGAPLPDPHPPETEIPEEQE